LLQLRYLYPYSDERKSSKKGKGVQSCDGTPNIEDLQAELNRLQLALEEMTQERDCFREENLKLKAEVEVLRSDVGVFGQENDQDIPTHSWSIGATKQVEC
jgi:predicted nuclease with TOPRIM domain